MLVGKFLGGKRRRRRGCGGCVGLPALVVERDRVLVLWRPIRRRKRVVAFIPGIIAHPRQPPFVSLQPLFRFRLFALAVDVVSDDHPYDGAEHEERDTDGDGDGERRREARVRMRWEIRR